MKLITLMENTAVRPDLHAEHGLSLYIETEQHKILFDAGQTGLFIENAETLGVDLTQVDLAILSHGHYDHSGGLTSFLSINDHAPVYMNERAFSDCWHGSDHYIGVDQTLKDSGRVVLTGDAHHLSDTLTLCTCVGLPRLHPASGQGLTIRQADGTFVQDEFLHEQYLMIEENGKRVLISGCSHKGILNIMSWLHPDILIGGFHFMKLDPTEDRAALKTAADELNKYDTVYYTCHCTGTEQYETLKEWMDSRLFYLSGGSELII